MKLSQILSMALAVGALTLSTASSALMITLSSGGDTETVVDGDAGDSLGSNAISTTLTVGDWDITVATSVVLDGPGQIFSLNTTAVDLPPVAIDSLEVVATAESFDDLGTLSAFHSDTSVFTEFSSKVEIDFGMGAGWEEISLFTSGAAATGSFDDFNIATGTSDYDLRITQIFSADGAAGGTTAVTVPEPSIIALISLGLVGMGIAARRKQS